MITLNDFKPDPDAPLEKNLGDLGLADITTPRPMPLVVRAQPARRSMLGGISALAASLAGAAPGGDIDGFHRLARQGHATKKVARKVHVNPQHETTVYRSRGHGNQHTPPNYPKTRRKRKTFRERSQDRCAAMWSLDGYDGWAKRSFAK